MRRWLSMYSVPACVVLFAASQAFDGDWWTAGFLAVIAWYLVLTLPERNRVTTYRAGYTRGVAVGIEVARAVINGRESVVPLPDSVHPDDRVTPAQLLVQAAQRVAELQAVVDGLDRLAESWEHLGPPKDPAAVLRGYLARPPIYAQEETDG